MTEIAWSSRIEWEDRASNCSSRGNEAQTVFGTTRLSYRSEPHFLGCYDLMGWSPEMAFAGFRSLITVLGRR